MTEAGFMASLDWIFELSADDKIDCMVCPGKEAVMYGVIATPCNCPQPLCLTCYDREKPLWNEGDRIHCYICKPKTMEKVGVFVRWEKV